MLPTITTMLSRIGLPPRIGEVYAFLTQKGEVAARDVAEMFSLPRSTAHDVLSSLVRHQLARSVTQGKEKTYVMESPEVVHRFFCHERDRIDEQVRVFEALMPMLQVLHDSKSTSSMIRYFTTEESVKKAWREFSALPGDVIQLTDESTFCVYEQSEGSRSRSEEGDVRSIVITDRALIGKGERSESIRCITPMLFDAKGTMCVSGDRIFLRGEEKNVAIEICSAGLANTCRAALELAWRAAQEWGVKK